MFVRCPRCRSLVATDGTAGAAPEFCPYCDSPLAEAGPAGDEEAQDAAEAALADSDGDVAEAAHTGGSAARETAVPDGEPANTAFIVADPSDAPAAEADRSADGIETATDAPTAAVAERAAEEAAATSAKPKPRKKKTAAPSFARQGKRAPDRPTPPWLWALAAALALLAGLQIVLADRAQLAADARWRPAIASLCATLRCSIPPWREPAAFAMLGREVRQHPYMPGALRVDASFRNNARWAQPWPDLVLTLSDVDGRALGTRTFAPKEYLGGAITQKEIGSGQSAAIRMEIMEPAPGVVAFSFDFR